MDHLATLLATAMARARPHGRGGCTGAAHTKREPTACSCCPSRTWGPGQGLPRVPVQELLVSCACSQLLRMLSPSEAEAIVREMRQARVCSQLMALLCRLQCWL